MKYSCIKHRFHNLYEKAQNSLFYTIITQQYLLSNTSINNSSIFGGTELVKIYISKAKIL